ncbi:MAG TPA: universal stress protein [Candidatus Dormibacteraeota bacterium]|jgi:nucleotide-binding universal stress UspA family protein|nr:universal stress protein [Candidatus Dormibacteraeota bacterium]
MDTGDSTFGYRGSIRVKRIVVAADGSPASARGLEQVAELASRVGARVVVVYVRHLPSAALMAPGIADASAMQTLDEQEAMVRQEALRLLGGAGVEWEFVVRAGSPGEEIVHVADESGADIVVVGSNRHSSLHNLLLGSTAAYLTAHSRAPVLVMRSAAPNSMSAAQEMALR